LTDVAQRAWWWVDWLPARASALGFAVVGSFEEAIDHWRAHAQRMGHGDNDAVILAATAGAVDVQLGGAPLRGAGAQSPTAAQAASDGTTSDVVRPTPGREPEPAHLRSVVGLVWRSVVLWLLLMALLTLARLTG
jgi:adenosylcobinamide-phosphate synthase